VQCLSVAPCFHATPVLVSQHQVRAESEKRDGKDERMEELLRRVDAGFLAMIKVWTMRYFKYCMERM
jgi:hypothetical protein